MQIIQTDEHTIYIKDHPEEKFPFSLFMCPEFEGSEGYLTDAKQDQSDIPYLFPKV